MKKNFSIFTLIFVTIIWGSAFIFQEIASEHISSFTFNFLRFGIASIVLLPFVIISLLKEKKKNGYINYKDIVIGSLLCGVTLSIASITQQYGIGLSSASKAGFITACYIVIVPIISLFLGKKNTINVYLAVGITLIGLYVFCINESFKLQLGDLLLIICAISFAFQIIVVEKFSKKVNNLVLSFGQIFLSFIICIIPCFVIDKPTISQIGNGILPVLYVAIFSTCLCYTLQIVSQKNINPTVASLIMSCESIFSAIFGFFILEQVLSNREIIGALIMILGILLAQLPEKWFKFKKRNCK